MIQHYVKVSELLMWIEKELIEKELKGDEDEEIPIQDWEEGYDAALNSMKDVLEDFPLKDDDEECVLSEIDAKDKEGVKDGK